MVNGCASTALRQVARVFHEGTLTGASDRQILERFVDRRDEAAFEVLVARHGPMVFNVCRQLVRDQHDVEDAFQAVFLVLIRKAASIRVEGSLGPWLYTVANRVAARARANRRRMATRGVSEAVEIAAIGAEYTLERDETAVVIQEELARLPERLRAPLVLCYLQGMTHELAAGQLGCPVGTVRSRLSRGRARLLRRITRRGLTLSAVALVSALESNARAATLSPIVRITLNKLATEWVSESAATAAGMGASASVAALLEGVLKVMRIKKLAIVAAALVGTGALGLLIADRAAAVGGTTIQESAQGKHDSDVRPAGSDGRPAGANTPGRPGSEFITQTYYVGDIIGVTRQFIVGSKPDDNTAPALRSDVDMNPIMDLISSTVAPSTWQTDETSGQVVGRRTNHMVPFYLSISLIIRSPKDVHDQVANLLRGLRVLLDARDNRTAKREAMDHPNTPQPLSSGPSLAPSPPSNASLPPPARGVTPANSGSRQRAQQLLDELQKEIQKLPHDKE
jgi:RNA polymerase sigma factor (sigma-70 family)